MVINFNLILWLCCADTANVGWNIFCLHYKLQTLVVIDSGLCLTSFPSFCAQPWEVAVLFNLNLSRRPFLRQVVNLDLLLCTGFYSELPALFLSHFSTQEPMNYHKMELCHGRCFGLQQLLPNSIENFISHKKIKSRFIFRCDLMIYTQKYADDNDPECQWSKPNTKCLVLCAKNMLSVSFCQLPKN